MIRLILFGALSCAAALAQHIEPPNGGGGGGGITQLTGDVTAGPGTGSKAATLATVNGSPGTCGDATHVCQVTTNSKGLTTAQAAVAITGGGGGASSSLQLTDAAASITTTST